MLRIDELQPGEHYIPVFERFEPLGPDFSQRYRTDSPIYQYAGNGEFVTEDGDPVNSFYDPELALDVAVDGADGFIQ